MAKDHWSSSAYNSAAGFVPKLASKVLTYLDPQPNDRILDLGCGDGSLTSQISQSASPGYVLGLDASASFIKTAQDQYTTSNCTFRRVDCTKLSTCADVVGGSWDKVFSNAAMHWILRDPKSRSVYFKDVHNALKSGGTFAFEMGGSGNVAEVQAAASAALLHAGVPLERTREANPWFFPSVEHMTTLLQDAGFEVEVCEHEYRPTRLTAETVDKSGGLEGWVKLMCAQFLEVVQEQDRDGVAKEICDVLEPIITRHEDGSRWLGYTRLRAVARKK